MVLRRDLFSCLSYQILCVRTVVVSSFSLTKFLNVGNFFLVSNHVKNLFKKLEIEKYFSVDERIVLF